jgi:pimeloyl-ACP methyl ester carboxylesterase/SAM-dependent methyltransferase
MKVNGVELAVQSFGDPGDPAIVLIAGAGTSMDTWAPEFCQRLAAGPRFVIRYDQRDTGESTTDSPGAPSYRFSDLVADIFGLLDHFKVARGHLVGISMGGAAAQVAALTRPERVASLTLIATTSIEGGGPKLPGMEPRLREFYSTAEISDYSDDAAVVDYVVAHLKVLAGDQFDEAAIRRETAATLARTRDIESALVNHSRLVEDDSRLAPLSTVEVPTLVIHGGRDPMFPLPHGRALAEAIPGARLLVVEGMGHEAPPPSTWDTVVPALLFVTSGGWPYQADRLAKRALAEGDPTGWFERLYAAGAAGEVALPWDTDGPRESLAEWAGGRSGTGRQALVVGAGLGQNSEFVASLGYDTTAFDISPTAIGIVRGRFRSSPVHYVVADLFDPPADWAEAFDLVVEVFTVQALPLELRARAIAAVAGFVAPGGTLLVIAVARDNSVDSPSGPPWPLSRAELDAFAVDLTAIRVEELTTGGHWWRAEFRRPDRG